MPVAESPPPGFYPPDPYAPIWVWVGAGILAVVALWYVWVWRSTRERPVVIPPRATPERLSRLRDDYTRQIDAVVRRARAGEITDRRAHQQLSVLLRHFVLEVSGVQAPAMTLTDLVASGPRLTPVSHVVSALYPGEFAPHEARTLAGAAAAAKEVVARWS
ncbi:hypothetical protein N865_12490 [Intrasporangium oryzae NRRL B-24470]|uniref:DUF4381 domain-containing protein n=1 Tax=Intrasporangium oryzae NRRL B-24470 TaxID=1386089 RepID=W9G747_9MICO|nr:hypothetical protein [Intrasporangium oryzae]EWT01860.1 hypothetical protein N865_12490 [Intrasporangium oryzae NRRL B-24470]